MHLGSTLNVAAMTLLLLLYSCTGCFSVELDHCAKGMSQLATQGLLAFQAMGSGGTARQPETGKGKDAPQYFGTVVYDPSSASNLPVLEW